MTLARYALTRKLNDAAALALASTIAKATPDHHPTSKDQAAKVSNFQSAWKSAKRNPERYQWGCSYALAGIDTKDSTALASRGCIGNKCSVWKDFKVSKPSQANDDDEQKLLNQTLWLAIAALASRGAEVRLSTILAELETLDEPTEYGWKATDADELAERELLSYILQNPETGLVEALLVDIPAAGFISVSEVDPKSYLEALVKENPCSPATFNIHLERVRNTGLRVMAKAQAIESATAFSDRRQPIPETLDNLLSQSRNFLRRTSSEIQPMEHHVPELLADLFSKPQNAIATPSQWLNNALNGGWLPGLLYVVGAPPGAGKTTFCCWGADLAATAKVPVLYVAYEMSRNQLWAYALARLSGMNSGLIESKRWMDDTYREREDLAREVSAAAEKYAQQIAPYFTILEAGPEHTAAKLKGAIAQVRHNAGLDKEAPVLCIIDYLQLMLSGDETLDSANAETLRVSRVATSLKQLARETGAAVLAISDITKVAYQQAIATGSLDMSALRDSFKIAHAADSILLLQTGKITVGRGDNTQNFDQLQLAAQKYPDKARLIDQARLKYPLNHANKDTYARLSILKNRGGVLAEPLFVYEKALHRFKPIDLNLGETSNEESI
jgi:replicative DNA helicase